MSLYQHLLGSLAPLVGDYPAWWRVLRKKAQKSFMAQGLPTKQWETYRYTPMARVIRALLGGLHRTHTEDDTMRSTSSPQMGTGYVIWIENGILMSMPKLPKGLCITSFKELKGDDALWLKQYLGKIASAEGHPFVALNTASLEDGILVRIAANTVLAQPIFLHHCSRVNETAALHPRFLFDVGKGSRAQLIEVPHAPDNHPLLINGVREVSLGVDAQLDYYTWPTMGGASAYQFNHMQVKQAKGSVFSHYGATFTGAFVRNYVGVRLQGSRACTNLYGCTIGESRVHRETHTVVVHEVADTWGDTYYKGLASGESNCVFHGSIHVKSGAQKTRASQYHHGWSLGKKAHIYTRPELFINADDVVCRHGATMTQANAGEMFYLQGRGIPRVAAQKMLIEAFLVDTTAGIGDTKMRGDMVIKIGEHLMGLLRQ